MDTVHRLISQPLVGVPDLYTLTPTLPKPIEEEDFRAIADLWKEYSDRMDLLHGKDIQ